MQLFLFLNDLAGRWPLLDEAARFFYVGALPALGTLLLAQLLLVPRPFRGASRSKTALALVLSLALGALIVWGFDVVAAQLHLGVLSPRPWMTRRVNWLVVEPQDNSFPCVELVLAAAIASASFRLNRNFGCASWVVVALLALARMFCGNNYFADVLVGVALGAGAFVLCAGCCERGFSTGRRAREIGLRTLPLVVTLLGCYVFALFSPRFEGKLGVGRAAAATPLVSSIVTTGAASSAAQGEGEGLGLPPGEGRAELLARAKRSTLFLPHLEKFLRGKLTPLARPFTLLDVEAAPVKAGSSSYRCVAIRFEVPVGEAQTRPLVADRAARLVRAAFGLDSQLQNVDIIGVARDQGRNLDGSQMVFAGDEVPVFTASIQRKNLLVSGPAWLNAPGVDGGSWLRARSLIYINERALPVAGARLQLQQPVTRPGQTTAPSPPTPRPSVTPLSEPAPTTSSRPLASASPTTLHPPSEHFPPVLPKSTIPSPSPTSSAARGLGSQLPMFPRAPAPTSSRTTIVPPFSAPTTIQAPRPTSMSTQSPSFLRP